MDKIKIKNGRQFMKSETEQWKNIKSDQMKKITQPPLEKPYDKDAEIIDLPEVNEKILRKTDIYTIFMDRESHRKYTEESLTLEELSFLLWASQGVKKVAPHNYCTMRTVPSAGARHPFETYLIINRVEGLEKGVYRYLAIEHKLILLFGFEDTEKKLAEMTLDQSFIGKSAVTFIWSCVPYRGEWRYDILAHKNMLIDAGHVCQNLYLACGAIGCGTCGIGAYDQSSIDSFLGLDGEDEYAVYLAPVGKI